MDENYDVIRDVIIYFNGERESAKIKLNMRRPCYLHFSRSNGFTFSAGGEDFFECLCELRRAIKDVTFLCKGAKLSVYPSRMMRDMAMGLKAYDHKMGMPATKMDEVDIFDYEDFNIAKSPVDQDIFWKEWLSVLMVKSKNS